MGDSDNNAFRDFELAGWETPEVCATYHENFSQITRQAVDALLDAAGASAGLRVLDVATGAGYAASAAAALSAEAVGVDFAGSQVELARQTYPNVTFEQGDAAALPFPNDSFDCVVNNFGIMHFPNPGASIRECYRVLKAGGRFAFTSFDEPGKAVGLGIFYGAIQKHGSLDADLPAGPNYFMFSDPATSESSLREAGFEAPTVAPIDLTWHVRSPVDVIRTIEEGTVRAAATLRAQSPDALQAIKAAVREAIEAYASSEGGYALPMPALVASASKPS